MEPETDEHRGKHTCSSRLCPIPSGCAEYLLGEHGNRLLRLRRANPNNLRRVEVPASQPHLSPIPWTQIAETVAKGPQRWMTHHRFQNPLLLQRSQAFNRFLVSRRRRHRSPVLRRPSEYQIVRTSIINTRSRSKKILWARRYNLNRR